MILCQKEVIIMFNLTVKLHNAFAPMWYAWAYLRCVHSS